MRNHYHVLSGFGGYLPDYNEVYMTREDANSGAIDWVGQLRDSGARIRGSARSGCYRVINPSEVGASYIEIVACSGSDCLPEDHR